MVSDTVEGNETKAKPLTNEGVNRFLCPPFQLCQFFLHLTLQIPVRSLGSNIENILCFSSLALGNPRSEFRITY